MTSTKKFHWYQLLLLFCLLISCSDSSEKVENEPEEIECTCSNCPNYKILKGNIGTWNSSSIFSNDGNLLIAGTESKDGIAIGMLLVKSDFEGNEIFRSVFNKEGSRGLSLHQSIDGFIYVIGYESETSPSQKRELVLSKLSHDGEEIWSKSYLSEEDMTGYHIIELNDGTLVLSGNRTSDLSLIKINKNGEMISSTIFPSEEYRSPSSMLLLKNSNILITGYDKNGAYLTEYDPNFNLIWHNTYCTTCTTNRSTIQLSNNDLISVGGDHGSIVIYKTDSQGELKWLKKLNLAFPHSDGQVIRENHDGSFIIAGYYLSPGTDNLVVTIDSVGNVLNAKGYLNQVTFRAENLLKTEDDRNLITGNHLCGIFLLNIDNEGNE